MKRVWVMVMGMVLAAGAVRAGSDEERLWEAISEPFRREPLSLRRGGRGIHTGITIEAGGRANPFQVPVAATELSVASGKPGSRRGDKGGKKGDGAKETSSRDVKRLLTDCAERIGKGEKAFEQGRYADLPPVKDIRGWEAALSKLTPEKPEEIEQRGDLLQRAGTLAAKVEARETFQQRAYTVHFVVVNEAFPERSVASIGGKLVRTKESFDDGVTVHQIRREGVIVVYKGIQFALPISRTER